MFNPGLNYDVISSASPGGGWLHREVESLYIWTKNYEGNKRLIDKNALMNVVGISKKIYTIIDII